jgi:hypothetical protein
MERDEEGKKILSGVARWMQRDHNKARKGGREVGR